MMFCWQARGRFADRIEVAAGAPDARLEAHLRSCDVCRLELSRLRQVRLVLSEAARTIPEAPAGFEQRVLREGRARLAARAAAAASAMPAMATSSGRPLPFLTLARPVPAAAALALLLTAVTVARFFHGGPLEGRAGVAAAGGSAAGTIAARDLDDGVVASPEVPFVVREDLVAPRRGRIPLTTYVLEPAPFEGSGAPKTGRMVMRASL